MDLSPEAIREALAAGEGRQIEFKQGLPRPDKVARILCAFANTRGGRLFVGVDDRGRVLGAGRARMLAGELRAIAREQVEPPLEVQVGVARLPEGPVVCCAVAPSRHRPHSARRSDGRSEVVVRVGASNRRASGATLRALRQPRAKRVPDELGRAILAWVARRGRRVRDPAGDKTVAGFAAEHNVGAQRARRAFDRLEREGRLVAHGQGARRVYHLA